MKKKVFIHLLMMALVFTAIIPIQKVNASGKTYHDVPGSWAQTDIEYLTTLGIISGYPDGSFGVYKNINRAEAAAIIIRALNIKGEYPTITSFTDTSDNYFRLQIALAAERGIISGYTNGEFRPEQPLTRSEMASIVVRAYPYLKGTTDQRFVDVNEKNWAFKSIETLVSNGITEGYPGNVYKPNQAITRAEFAVFITRILKKHYLLIHLNEMLMDATNINIERFQELSAKIKFTPLQTFGIEGQDAMKLYAPFNGTMLWNNSYSTYAKTSNGGSIFYGGRNSFLIVSDNEEYIISFSSFPQTVTFTHYFPADSLSYRVSPPVNLFNAPKVKPLKKGLEFLLLNVLPTVNINGEIVENKEGSINLHFFVRDYEAEKLQSQNAYQEYLTELEEWKVNNPDYEKLGLTPPVYNDVKNKIYKKVDSMPYLIK